MDAFTLLNIERNVDIRPRVTNVAIEITRACPLALEWDNIFCNKTESNEFADTTIRIIDISEIYWRQ